MKMRLLDFGAVSPLRSQTLWHGIAYAMGEGSPNTVSMMSPAGPYLCIGYHQELEKEVDLDFCRGEGLFVARREVGGGAVYLDGDQVFTHFICHRGDAPPAVEEVYRRFAQPAVETYRAIGIPAYHRPVNDIQVAGRKIGGMGAALLGEAMVVASSLMFDFDHERMARALKVSSEKMRDKVYQSIKEYVTTIRRELADPPPREAVVDLFLKKCRETLGIDLERGEMTDAEWRAVEEMDRRFVSPEWLHQKEGLPREGIKIKEGMRIQEAVHKAPGGLIRATVRLHEEVIEDLTLSGDFTMIPGRALPRLEEALRGGPFWEADLMARALTFYRATGAQSPGVTAEDFVRAVVGTKAA